MRYSGNVLRDTGFDQNTRWSSGKVLRDTGYGISLLPRKRDSPNLSTRCVIGKKTIFGKAMTKVPLGGGEELGLLGLIFAGYVPLASQNPYPTIIYYVAIL